MFGNGATIGMDIIPVAPKRTPPARQRRRHISLGFCVGVAFSIMGRIAARRTEKVPDLPTAATT
jgi:hypothetical protein